MEINHEENNFLSTPIKNSNFTYNQKAFSLLHRQFIRILISPCHFLMRQPSNNFQKDS